MEWSALHWASAYGNTATVLVLLEYGAQVDILDDVSIHRDVNCVKMHEGYSSFM